MNIVFAQGSEIVTLGSGTSVRVAKGTHWPATDPVVRARPALFTTDPRFGLFYTEAPPGYDGQLNELGDEFESASAAPGEKRSVRRRREEVSL